MPRKPVPDRAKRKETGAKHRLVDRRLLGRWKSDRRRTFRNLALPEATPGGLRKLKAIFGHMIVTWRPRTVTTEFQGSVDTQHYEVIARDELSVVVRIQDEYSWLLGELRQIYFDEDHYRLCTGVLPIVEFFRKLNDRAAPRKMKKRNHG
jgi:hypothetical protein